MKETSKVYQKWGFGMAPLSRNMQVRFEEAVKLNLKFLEGNLLAEEMELNHISELKGMFNRCIRQDQWDWFTVYTEMGRPPYDNMNMIATALKNMRLAIKDKHLNEINVQKELLIQCNILHYLYTFLEDIESKCLGLAEGWIYIISTRELPQMLKIGMTTRTVETRVKEINSVTGVIYPFSVRKTIRVSNPQLVEKCII